MENNAHAYGEKLVMLLKNKEIKKDIIPNANSYEFTNGMEGIHKMRFCNYISSCSNILIDERLKETSARGYLG